MTWDYFECNSIEWNSIECNSIKCNFIEYKFYFLCIKMVFQKIVIFLDRTSDNKDLQWFVTKNGLKFMINQKKNITQTKKIELKHKC